MNFDHIDDHLPKGSSNKNLEKISRNKFEQLLHPEKFQVRPETEADVGIDFVVELKRNNHHTNFRFAVQLKATGSIAPKADGSYMFPVDVANVNYLFNFSGPSFYVLYVQNEDTFYYKNAHAVFMQLSETYAENKWPATVGVKFTDVLDLKTLDTLHDQIFSRSKTIRHVNHLLNVNLQKDDLADRVTIGENEEVIAASEIVLTIEKKGMSYLNAYRYDEILRLKSMVDVRTIKSGMFHAICGLAHYRKAEMHQAIVAFKLAQKFKESFKPAILDMIFYHQESAKYMLGINTRLEYDAAVDKVINSDYIGLFLSIERSYYQLFDEEGLTAQKVTRFYQQMEEICSHPDADDNIIIHARAQILEMESEVLNNSLIRNISVRKSMPWITPHLQKEWENWRETAAKYLPRAEDLLKQAHSGHHYFAYNIITLTMVKAHYCNMFTQLYMMNFDEQKLIVNVKFTGQQVTDILENCRVLDEVIGVYEQLDSNENVIVAQALKYELLHFIGHTEEAAKVAAIMEELIDTYDLKDLHRRYRYLIDQGTKHELFLQHLIETFKRKESAIKERDEIVEALRELDELDQTFQRLTEPCYNITLTPLGNFRYPKVKFDLVMDILEVTDPIREQVLNMSQIVLPILNCFQQPIAAEGPGIGQVTPTIEGYRNLLRIRKAFSVNQFIRSPH